MKHQSVVLCIVSLVALALVIACVVKKENFVETQHIYDVKQYPDRTPSNQIDCTGSWKRDQFARDAAAACKLKYGDMYDIVKAGCDGPLDAASGDQSQQCGYCPSYYCDINLNPTKVLQKTCTGGCAQKDPDLINMCVKANGDLTKCNFQAYSNMQNCISNCGPVGDKYEQCLKNNGDFSKCARR